MKARVMTAVVLAAIAISVFVKVHVMKDEGGGGSILWNDGEAYLFMYDHPIGYRVSVLAYLLEPLKEYFYAPATSDGDTWNLVIIRITSAGVERHEQEFPVGPSGFTPIDGLIYAHCPGGVCKWAGTQFRLISDQEEQKIGGEGALKMDFADINGWSKREVKAAWAGDTPPKPYDFSINLSQGIKLLVRGDNPVSVDLLQPDHASKRVWYHEQRTRRVSTAEYEQVFRPH
jgi:hypothetical protein